MGTFTKRLQLLAKMETMLGQFFSLSLWHFSRYDPLYRVMCASIALRHNSRVAVKVLMTLTVSNLIMIRNNFDEPTMWMCMYWGHYAHIIIMVVDRTIHTCIRPNLCCFIFFLLHKNDIKHDHWTWWLVKHRKLHWSDCFFLIVYHLVLCALVTLIRFPVKVLYSRRVLRKRSADTMNMQSLMGKSNQFK